MSFYANITLKGPEQRDVVALLGARGIVAYVSPTVEGCTVVWHEDLSGQEQLASALSARFRCPALLVMGYGEAILLYHLYVNGDPADTYVSTPHEGLELDGPTPGGNAKLLSEVFGVEMDHLVARVERVLRKPGKPNTEYAFAVNRHGELARALGLPQFAAGSGFNAIEVGELPEGKGFEISKLRKTPLQSAG